MGPALRHLTNLTYLRLKAPEVVLLEPITSIQKIEKVCLSSTLLVDHKGDLVFPALTNLTCLELIRDISLPSPEQYGDRMSGRLLEVNLYSECRSLEDICVLRVLQILRPCASTLKSLAELNCYYHMFFPTRDWSGLEGFRKLETLHIGHLAPGNSIEHLETALRNMGAVT